MSTQPRTLISQVCHILMVFELGTLPYWGTACSSVPKQGTHEQQRVALQQPALSDSSVEIHYVLGHSHRRFVAKAKNESCMAQTYLDRQILKETSIDGKRYEDFFTKATQFIQSPHRNPAEHTASLEDPRPEMCRSPFTVTLRTGANTETVKGCRGMDDGFLSHLIREGEFLLFSKK
ncbi:hypothetical protein WDW37_05485 [Bdellovibrionota bacterium FG-1]